MKKEREDALKLMKKLCTSLDAKGNQEMAKKFTKGLYKEPGYGVPEGAAILGSFALGNEGSQGYFVDSGKEVFLNNVESMKSFFKTRAERIGKPIKLIIKCGIGGQHTPFQGIADCFARLDSGDSLIIGEYELGKDFGASIAKNLKQLNAGWDQIAVIPSSKSGSTDETMMIFVSILNILLQKCAQAKGIDGEKFSQIILKTLHEINFIDQQEKSSKELFKTDKGLIASINENTIKEGLEISSDQIKEILSSCLGNMFLETVDNPSASRLSAFIRNSGLDKALGEDAPGFGAMFDNVGGRWTADLHMMTFLAFFDLDAEKYWQRRLDNIKKHRENNHLGNRLAEKILDEKITDIALVLDDEYFWFGKSVEQNFNESVWQEGFANLVAIKKSLWQNQKKHYENHQRKLVICISHEEVDKTDLNFETISAPDLPKINKEDLVLFLADLFGTFYSMTSTTGNNLIVRTLKDKGFTINEVDLNDCDNAATKIVQENLYVLQPYVEFGKKLLKAKLEELQKLGKTAVEAELSSVKQNAKEIQLKTNITGLDLSNKNIAEVFSKAIDYARKKKRKFVPLVYLNGEEFDDLRDHFFKCGIEWVMQGTGDQHISVQQVLAQPQKYLPMIISFVPEQELSGLPAIGFAKGYLDKVSPHMVRDAFAEATFQALTESEEVKEKGGEGIFLRLSENKDNILMIRESVRVK